MIDASRIAAIFERFTSGYHFYLEDLRSGESVELGERAAWPIGSCFKLAVLIAYSEALADGTLPPGSLDAETVIPPDRISAGSGVVNLLDTPIRLSDRQMIRLMISASDGTATDFLIDKLGLERVQATLRRAAPESTIACGQHEMVRSFWEIPGALECKTRDWTTEEARSFRDATSRLGATHAEDLCRLVQVAFDHLNNNFADEHFASSMKKMGRAYSRTESFLQNPIMSFNKGGSLGRTYFLTDCAVIFDATASEPLYSFGYCSEGWRLPAFVVETICGLIGLEMAAALGIAVKPNWDFTPEGAKLLLGDLWPA